MHVLMLSRDDRIFEEGSEVRERIRAYGSLFDSLHVSVFTTRRKGHWQVAPNVHLHPIAPAVLPVMIAEKLITGSIPRKLGRPTVITAQDAATFAVARSLAFRARLPLQLQIHTDFSSPAYRAERPFSARLYRWAARRADCIRVVSERIRRELVSELGIAGWRVSLLPIFVDAKAITLQPPTFNLRRRCIGSQPIILWVGRLTPEKNAGLALEVMAEVVKELPQALLVIVGDGPEQEKLKVKSQTLKVAGHARFEGWQRDVVSYYKGADVLLVTSRYEGYGRMLVEAAAAGLPIVSTDVGLVGELLRPGEHLLTFGTAAEGAQAIERLMNGRVFRDRLRENAQQAAAHLPDFPSYLQAYRAALERCPARADTS